MMVVHEDNEKPVEVAVIRKPLLEQKSYVIVKNHVRELIHTAQKTSVIEINKDMSPQISQNMDSKKKKRKTDKKLEETPTTSFDSEIITSRSTQIDPNDMEELRTVYLKCKEVVNKIETKYGHLLGLDSEVSQNAMGNKRKASLEASDDECQCKLNKKIVFDDDGRQLTVDSIMENHICAKKMKSAQNTMQTSSKDIAVEYNDTATILPDDLNELLSMLQDRNIAKTLRNEVLDKIKLLKQEYVNDLKFNRHILIEKVKSNPEDVLNFKGTNLSKIPGYS